MEKWYKESKDDAQFYVVYIKEAHPADGRRPIPNAPNSPKNDKERQVLASRCISEMKLTIPCVVDDIKDTASAAYASHPDRIFIIHAGMKIAYAGARVPFGFKPDEAMKALKDLIAKKNR